MHAHISPAVPTKAGDLRAHGLVLSLYCCFQNHVFLPSSLHVVTGNHAFQKSLVDVLFADKQNSHTYRLATRFPNGLQEDFDS